MLIITRIGKIKEQSMALAEAHYLDMLKKNGVAVEVRVLKGFDDVEKDTALMIEKFEREKFVFVLTENGKEFTSENFSRLLNPAFEFGQDMNLLIAGPFGWNKKPLPRHFQRVSLSLMTMPHELAYIVLLEQIYRGYKIFKGQKYHY